MAYTTIDDPSAHFQTALYTGNATQRNITNDGNSDLQPDWVWIKCRSAVEANMLYDSTRGVTKDLRSDTNAIENTNAQGLQAFNSDGFQLGTLQNVNFNTKTMVAWQWKANGGTTTDVSASGSGDTQIIASTHQANTEAGFSIVTFTAPNIGSGNNYTVSHGLGAVPEVIILKSRNVTGNWHVYHQATGPNGVTFLNRTDAFYDNIYFADTTPSSTVFTVGARTSLDPDHTAVAYCFRSIKGYSKTGSYVGNGNVNGPFVHLGFKPNWLMVKSTTSTEHWNIPVFTSDANGTVNTLSPNLTNAERTMDQNPAIDFLSNGFKIRTSDSNYNNDGQTFIYMAFAEHPFVSSKGVPTTAR